MNYWRRASLTQEAAALYHRSHPPSTIPTVSIHSRTVRCGLQTAAPAPTPPWLSTLLVKEFVHMFLVSICLKHPSILPRSARRTLDGDTWWNAGYACVARRGGGAGRVVDQPTEEGVGKGEEKEEGGRKVFRRCSGTHASSCRYFDDILTLLLSLTPAT